MRNTLEISGILLAVLLAAMAFHAWLTEHDDRLRLQATIATQKQALDAADARERDRAATLKDTVAQIDALKRSTQTPAQVVRDLPKYLSLPQPITLSSRQNALPAARQGTAQSEMPTCGGKKRCPSSAAPSTAAAASATAGSHAPESAALAAPADQQDLADAFSTAEGSPGSASAEPSAPENQQELPDAPSAQIPAVDLKPLFDYVQDCRSCQAQLAAAKQDSADNATKLAALTRERDAAVATAKGGTLWQRLHRNALWFVIGAGAGAATLCATGHCR